MSAVSVTRLCDDLRCSRDAVARVTVSRGKRTLSCHVCSAHLAEVRAAHADAAPGSTLSVVALKGGAA